MPALVHDGSHKKSLVCDCLRLFLSWMRCLLTAGPTREHLDPVRFLSNGSSGKMGYALAAAAARRGWVVDLVSGPVALPAPPEVRVHRVTSAEEMLEATRALFPAADLFIAVAAVCDFRPVKAAIRKLKKAEQSTHLELEPTPDILKTLALSKRPNQRVVGFAAETHDVEAYARVKLDEKNLDWIVANDVSQPDTGMNADDNRVVLLSRDGQRFAFGPRAKGEVAEFILQTVLGTG